MANRHMKRSLTSLITREMQTKTHQILMILNPFINHLPSSGESQICGNNLRIGAGEDGGGELHKQLGIATLTHSHWKGKM